MDDDERDERGEDSDRIGMYIVIALALGLLLLTLILAFREDSTDVVGAVARW